MVKIKTNLKISNNGVDVEKGEHLITAGGSTSWYSQSLWHSVWGFHKNLEIDLPHDQAIALMGQRDLHPTTEILAHPCSLFSVHNSQKMKQPRYHHVLNEK